MVGVDDATVDRGGLMFLASGEAANALRLLQLPAARDTEGGPEGFGGVLVLLLLTGDHLMGERV